MRGVRCRVKLGQCIDVVVEELHDDWAIVSHDGRRAILQATEVTWEHPAGPLRIGDYITIDSKVPVIVTAVSGDRFSVRLKRMQPNPWHSPPAIGSVYQGVVRSVAEYGYFVTLTKHFVGLLLKNCASRLYETGELLDVEVVECDIARERIRVIESHD